MNPSSPLFSIRFLLSLAALFSTAGARAQLLQSRAPSFTRADSLRGSLRAERAYDVLRYNLEVKVNPAERSLQGCNEIRFKPDSSLPVAQVDLFANMKVDSIVMRNRKLSYRREYNAVFICFPKALKGGRRYKLRFYYSGNPKVAKNPPWDGGFVWEKDQNGKPWVGAMVQGIGASLWWPNKDTQSDEPDYGMSIKVDAPDGLTEVSNGRFEGKRALGDGYTQWSWRVSYPINNYDVTLNLGDYVHFAARYDRLPLDYYALSYNAKKAKAHFTQQVNPMLQCFQRRFGPYPFRRDGYKLIESFGLGMEHQSAIAYGNRYKMGYRGRDLSHTDIGLGFDFIIVHESAHEWFGNSITAADIADMWIHEAFATYAESIYVACRRGPAAAQRYLNGLKENVRNDKPIVGSYGVNREGSEDMYYKGALMLNTLRHVIDDDALWWRLIHDFTETYRHQIINGETVISFFNRRTETDLRPIFEAYLKYAELPVLELRQTGSALAYRWRVKAAAFAMPVDVRIGNQTRRLKPTKSWQRLLGLKVDQLKPLTQSFFIKVRTLPPLPPSDSTERSPL